MDPSIRDAITQSIATLSDAGVPFEELAVYEPAGRRFIFTTRANFKSRGKVWRLGSLLLSPDGILYSVGTSTRAVRPQHPNNQSLSAEARRHFRDTAFRGPFREGSTLNFDAHAVDWTPTGLANKDRTVFEADGRILVRWRPGADATNSIPFTNYLAEKVSLAVAAATPAHAQEDAQG